MITGVSLFTVYVTDQDETKAWYLEHLGFEERTDVSMGNGFRWVTIGHPSLPELEITLMKPGPPWMRRWLRQSDAPWPPAAWAVSASTRVDGPRSARTRPAALGPRCRRQE